MGGGFGLRIQPFLRAEAAWQPSTQRDLFRQAPNSKEKRYDSQITALPLLLQALTLPYLRPDLPSHISLVSPEEETRKGDTDSAQLPEPQTLIGCSLDQLACCGRTRQP